MERPPVKACGQFFERKRACCGKRIGQRKRLIAAQRAVLLHERDEGVDIGQRAGNVHRCWVSCDDDHRYGKNGRRECCVKLRAASLHMRAGKHARDVPLHGERRGTRESLADVAGVIFDEKRGNARAQFSVTLYLNHTEFGGE